MDILPTPKLAPEAMPWARTVAGKVQSNETAIQSLSTNVTATTAATASNLNRLQQQISDLSARTAYSDAPSLLYVESSNNASTGWIDSTAEVAMNLDMDRRLLVTAGISVNLLINGISGSQTAQVNTRIVGLSEVVTGPSIYLAPGSNQIQLVQSLTKSGLTQGVVGPNGANLEFEIVTIGSGSVVVSITAPILTIQVLDPIEL